MKRFTSLMLMLLVFASAAMADLTQHYYKNGNFWQNAGSYPEALNGVIDEATVRGEGAQTIKKDGATVQLASNPVTVAADGNVVVTFTHQGGDHMLNILGVDLVDAEGNVVASDYHYGSAGGTHYLNEYTLESLTAGASLTLRSFVYDNTATNDRTNSAQGYYTVTNVVVVTKPAVDTDGDELVANQLYRLKHKLSDDKYLHITQYNAAEKIQIKSKSNSTDQFFELVPTGSANEYKLKSASGYYVQNTGAWNCQAVTSGSTPYLVEEKEEGIYLLKSAQGYFGTNEGITAENAPLYTNHPAARNGATWTFEKVETEVVNTLAGFNSNKMYTISTTTRGGWSVGATSEKFESTTDGGLGTVVDPTNTRNQFAVLSANGTDYYLFSVHANKFVKADQTTVAGVADALNFTDASSQGAGRVMVNFRDVNNAYINLGGGNQMIINAYGAAANEIDGGNSVLFVECGDFDPTEALAMLNEGVVEITYNFTYKGEATEYTQTVTTNVGEEYPAITVALPFGITATKPAGTIAADAETTVTIPLEENLPFAYYSSYNAIENWYYVKLKGANYLYHEAGKDHIALDQATVPAAGKAAYSWAFVGDPFNGFQLVNMAAGEGYVLSSTTSITDDANTHPVMTASPVVEGNNELWVLTTSTYQTNGFYMAQKGIASNRMNNRNGKLAYWTGGADNGSTFTVELRPSSVAELTALVDQAEALLAQITIGEAVGQYSTNYEGDYETAYAEIAAYVEGGEMEETVAEEYVITLSAIINSFSLNMPEAGKYYTFSNGGYYITSNVANDRIACSETKDATAIYYFDGSHLLAYSTGLYFGLNANDWTFEAVGSDDISAIEFVAAANGAAGKFNIKSGGRWLHRTDAFINRCSNNTCGELHNWTIEEVETLPVSITAAGYATFFAPVAVTVAAGVTAYTVTVDGDVANLNEIGATIPANTGVVLAGAEKAYDFAITTAAAFEGENALHGTAAATNVTEAAYVLGNVNGVGFYTAAMTEGAWLNNSHKAYLPKGEGMNAVSYSFRFEDGTTAIENVEVENEVKAIYDLTGRRVEEITAPGIYIVNGKKTLVK